MITQREHAPESQPMALYPLPATWQWGTVSDVGADQKNAIVDGPFGSNLKLSDYVADGTVPVLTTKNLDGTYDDLRYISQKKFEELKRSAVYPGDILIAKIGSCGKTGIYSSKVAPAMIPANLLKVSVNQNSDRKYVYYYFNSPFFQKALKTIIKATAQPAFGVTNFRKLPLPIAPLPVQHEIVSEIEKQFSRLDEAVAGLKRIKANLKRYKAAVLKAAIEGKLTEEWRKAHPNVETGAELLKRILTERKKTWEEKNPGKKYKEPAKLDNLNLMALPKGWVYATAEQLTDENRAITYGVIKLGETVDGGVPVLRSSDVRQLQIDLASVKSISPEIAANYRRTFLRGGEVVMTVRGTLGGIAVIPPQCNGFNVSREVAMLALVEPAMAHLIAVFIASAPLKSWLMRRTKGIAYTGINIETLKALPIPVPPFAEQQRIVAEVDRRLSLVREVETQVDVNLKRAERLRQGILKKAFSGQLVQ